MKKLILLFMIFVGCFNNLYSMNNQQEHTIKLYFHNPEKRQFFLDHINVPGGFLVQELSQTIMGGQNLYYIKWDIADLTLEQAQEIFANAQNPQQIQEIIQNQADTVGIGWSSID